MTNTRPNQDSPRPQTNMMHMVLYGVISLILVAIFAVMITIFAQSIAPTEDSADGVTLLFEQDDAFDGIDVFSPPRAVPDFTLTSHTNEPLSLSDLEGKPILLSFGFTNCPDICPLTLNEFKQVREALGETGDDVQYLFISVDGSRDTPDVLANYFRVRRLDDFMLGMTGEEVDLRRIGVDYNLRFEYGPVDENGRYNVDHTAGSFLIDAEGNYVAKFAFGTESDVIADYIANLLENGNLNNETSDET
jgi:protein SCO1/2